MQLKDQPEAISPSEHMAWRDWTPCPGPYLTSKLAGTGQGWCFVPKRDAGACTPAAGLLSMLQLTRWRQLASSVWRKGDPKGSNTSEQTWDLGCSKWLFHSHINTMQSRVSPNTDLDHSKETRQSSRAIVRVGVETVSLTESLSSQAGNRFTTALTHGGNILMFQQGCTTA